MVEIIAIVFELVENMLHSTVEGLVGVSGIFIYLAAIVIAAVYRIWENIQEDSH